MTLVNHWLFVIPIRSLRFVKQISAETQEVHHGARWCSTTPGGTAGLSGNFDIQYTPPAKKKRMSPKLGSILIGNASEPTIIFQGDMLVFIFSWWVFCQLPLIIWKAKLWGFYAHMKYIVAAGFSPPDDFPLNFKVKMPQKGVVETQQFDWKTMTGHFGKYSRNMVIFDCYVGLPEGNAGLMVS